MRWKPKYLSKQERVARAYPMLGPVKTYGSLTEEDWAEIRAYFGDLAGGVCEEEGCTVRDRLQPHHDHALVADLAEFRAYSFYGQEVNLHRIYGRRVIRMLCPLHHRDKHPEHHDEEYRRSLKENLERFEAWLAELQQQKDTSERSSRAPDAS